MEPQDRRRDRFQPQFLQGPRAVRLAGRHALLPRSARPARTFGNSRSPIRFAARHGRRQSRLPGRLRRQFPCRRSRQRNGDPPAGRDRRADRATPAVVGMWRTSAPKEATFFAIDWKKPKCALAWENAATRRADRQRRRHCLRPSSSAAAIRHVHAVDPTRQGDLDVSTTAASIRRPWSWASGSSSARPTGALYALGSHDRQKGLGV